MTENLRFDPTRGAVLSTGSWVVVPRHSRAVLQVGHLAWGFVEVTLGPVAGWVAAPPASHRPVAELTIGVAELVSERRRLDRWLRSAAGLNPRAHPVLDLRSAAVGTVTGQPSRVGAMVRIAGVRNFGWLTAQLVTTGPDSVELRLTGEGDRRNFGITDRRHRIDSMIGLAVRARLFQTEP